MNKRVLVSIVIALIFLMFKELIIGGTLILISILLFCLSLFAFFLYVGKGVYKELFSPEARARQKQELKEQNQQRTLQKEKDRPIYNKRSMWKD